MQDSAEEDRAGAAGRGAQPRGRQRQHDLVQAGVELLAERGWAAVTGRAVAERAGTHQGLVHYHFGGLRALKRQVAAVAAAAAFEPAVEALTAHHDIGEGIAAAIRAWDGAPPEHARISAELIAASLQDAQVADLMRGVLADTRSRLVAWLAESGASEPEGLATLVVAALDGLVLHRLIDPGLPLRAAAAAAEASSRLRPPPRPA